MDRLRRSSQTRICSSGPAASGPALGAALGPGASPGPRALLARLAAGLILLLAAPPAGAEAPDYPKLREEMVRRVELVARITGSNIGISELDSRVLDAMRSVPRHLFVPAPLRGLAYNSHPLPLGHDQNLASPYLVALMTHLAELKRGDVVYETGTGAGYHAAVLSKLVARVYSVEVVEPLARQAADNLSALKVANAHTRHGDGYYGWEAKGPFDAIIIKEAVDHLPVPLVNQLKPGGRMVVPLSNGGEGQYLTVVRKRFDGSLSRTRVLPVIFSPLQGGERT